MGITRILPGTKLFYKSIVVPGVKVGYVARVRLGLALVALIADPDTTTPLETLRKQYLDACEPDLPLGTNLIVTIARHPANNP